ncbi:hypothetical protein, partial [Aeromonas enteropelogenes]|uniref:hypothetical protein n=1 Tax=Aeromonas enteropelogenes TaxID=29489 RepID=UPI003BA2CDA6
EDGGDQITKSSVSSIQAVSIWATTPLSTYFLPKRNPPVAGGRIATLTRRRCYPVDPTPA